MTNKKYLQRLGEDCAYTFKELFKTADWLKLEYKLYLAVPIIFSIVSLGFEDMIPAFWLKVMAVLSMIFTSIALMHQSEYEKIEAYMKLGNDFKTLYDDIESDFYRDDISRIEEFKERIERLRKKTTEFPINIMGRFWAKNKIEKEMNLEWLKEAES